jgi:hypothetical protein
MLEARNRAHAGEDGQDSDPNVLLLHGQSHHADRRRHADDAHDK